MSKHVDLPGGQHAVLRDPTEVTERQRRPIQRAMRGVRPEIAQRGRDLAAMPDNPDGTPTEQKAAAQMQLQYDMTNEEADAYVDATDHATVALVESWSFGNPVTLDGLLDLPGRSLDKLRAAVAPLVQSIFLDVSPSPEKDSPFGRSNGSETPSTEAPSTTSLTSGVTSASSA